MLSGCCWGAVGGVEEVHGGVWGLGFTGRSLGGFVVRFDGAVGLVGVRLGWLWVLGGLEWNVSLGGLEPGCYEGGVVFSGSFSGGSLVVFSGSHDLYLCGCSPSIGNPPGFGLPCSHVVVIVLILKLELIRLLPSVRLLEDPISNLKKIDPT